MAEHYLAAMPETVHWGYFDPTRAPLLRVASGDTVTIDTLSGEPADMPHGRPELEVLPEHLDVHAHDGKSLGPHFMTGPVFVEGAEPGDVLEVRIKRIVPRQNWGWTLIAPLLGTLPEDFPEHKIVHIPIDIEAGTCTPPWGTTLALKPFFGVMGVAPPPAWGRVSSVEPREHGGNMDNKELVAGTTLYLPVFNEGALFSVGDGHGVQGDGEVCLTALETALSGTFELIVRKDMSLTRPRAESASELITMAFDPDLDDAAKTALRDMIALLASEHGMSREDAYMLCSLAADMRVTQLVDGNKGIHTVLAKAAI
ncbi:acetamidase/formamidase family protein [Acuticoccus mangrovi]|uniref:Acetamidase/formamidase family protein n=1 Tax=Acuticoccus mangrovi TaxID=2796142 RepID=A0A934MI29_9HYPH|nr:acetamidase/formamidase family protein [Acuticoccus mangrovi]MBJ3776741.1 acetamidase/formamidase family protein [Acuticoccus mangrovi]